LGGAPGTSTQSLPHQSPALACTSPGARTSAVGGPGKPGQTWGTWRGAPYIVIFNDKQYMIMMMINSYK